MSDLGSSNEITGGLTTKEATFILYRDIKKFLDDLEPQFHQSSTWIQILRQAYSRKSVHSTFRWTSILLLILSIITYIIACKCGHFTTSVPLSIENFILILVLILNIGLIYWISRSRHLELYNKARNLSDLVRQCASNQQLMQLWSTHIHFSNTNTPTSPCITLQWTYRDGRLVNLPVALLVRGDVILMSPGRKSPANCRRISKVMKRHRKIEDFNVEDTIERDGDQTNFNQSNTLGHTFTYVLVDDEKDPKNDLSTLSRGQIFAPRVENEPDPILPPRFRKALKPIKFLVTETPYVNDLKFALNTNRRSPTAFEKELRLIFVHYLERVLVSVISITVLVFSVIHYCYVEFNNKKFDTGPATIALILLRPIMAILPLLPLALPLLWLILNAYGLIKLDILYEYYKRNEDKLLQKSKSHDNLNDSISTDQDCDSIFTQTDIHLTENPFHNLNLKDLREKTSTFQREYFLDEIDPERIHQLPSGNLMLQEILKKIFFFLYKDEGNLWRTANLLHVLGSITALCCVDKKGVLSWPNPIADKVFFLSSPSNQNRKKSTHVFTEPSVGEPDLKTENKEEITISASQKTKRQSSLLTHVSRAECVQLDVTHDRKTPYGLQFDDIYWGRYLSNLKPLGLAILLNTCNLATQKEFIHFSDHMACESISNEVAVPVVSKRCLCELARQIGFKAEAIKDYEFCYQVGVFRHIRPEVIQHGKLAKSLNFPRLKMPFPNMTCAVIRDMFSQTSQLFSQGTGDLILETCVEYWNGQNLQLLTDYEKKKILDFYQRASLTSYCCSFAYIPLINETAGSSKNSNMQTATEGSNNFYQEYYLELPPDSAHLFPSQRSSDSNLRGLGIDSHYSYSTQTSQNLDQFTEINSSDPQSIFLNSDTKLVGHHLSTDSISKHVNYNSSGDATPITVISAGDSQSKSLSREASQEGARRKQSATSKQIDMTDKNVYHKRLEQTMNKVKNEVFIGMATLQYQACADFVRLVELLDTACVRFVHFSKENELRSRVFSEKMGLESGWNCHISLLNEQSKEILGDKKTESPTKLNHRNSISLESISSRRSDSSSSTSSSSSDSDNEKVEEIKRRRFKHYSTCSDRCSRSREFRSASKASGSCSTAHRNMSPSPSRHTTSTMTDENSAAPIPAYDMSNRAKLPKGIDNIRPHLEKVDNVPLLVSLFTDCTPEATKEMIRIMQEYDEVVCVIGSMANDSNMPIFLQADASIGVEPMYPYLCTTQSIRPIDDMMIYQETNSKLEYNLNENVSPIQLANRLVSLPCSMTMPRLNAIIFYYLILISRDYMMRMRNVFQFFLSSCLSLSLAQMITSLVFLPPLFSPGIVLWLSLIVIPFLSVSLMGIKPDPTVMTVATGKKLHLNKETIVYFFLCYIIKFTPSILVCVSIFAIIIGTSCQQTKVGSHTLGPCWMFSDVKTDGDIKTDLIWSSHLLIGQTLASFFLVLYLVIISMGFVHRNHLLWQRCPFSNFCWLGTSIALIFCHIIVCILEIYIYVPEAEITEHFLAIIPFYIWIIGFSWPILLITINIFTKRREIKMNVRQQRRARLDFGTKLGMNSPF